MQALRLWQIFLGVFLQTALCYAAGEQNAFIDHASHAKFPLEVVVETEAGRYELAATGLSVHKQEYSREYVAAHYLQKPIKGLRKEVMARVFSDDVAKELIVRFLHAMDAGTYQKEVSSALQADLTAAQLESMKPHIEKFIALLGNPVKDEFHIYRWLPGGVLEVDINGTFKGRIINKPFAERLWQVWLGSNALVSRSQLLDRAIEQPKEPPIVIFNPK
jgi:hypothetical protein